MTLYRQKYRIESARCPNWDYSSGAYLVTICTKNRVCFLGDVVNGKMQLSAMGAIVAEEWQKTAIVRPYIGLGAWVVMPNHFHAIITIAPPPIETFHQNTSPSSPVETFRWNVSPEPPRLKTHSLGAIVGQFKSICTKRIWAEGNADFAWQPRFHDRIIRDEDSARQIQDYIEQNPTRWETDCHHPARHQ